MGRSVKRRVPKERASGSPTRERPLTARDVAECCGVELKTVHNWVERGLLRHFRTPGRHLRFQRGQVEDFLARHAGVTETASVLLIGVRARGAIPGSWTFVDDALDGLCRAGLEQPAVVVVDSKSLEGLDDARYARSLRRCLPNARLVWIGSSGPRRIPHVEVAADIDAVKGRLIAR
jgi:excisionase family DNA binding protein